MAKYRKKPVVIEAIQFNGDNSSEIAAFMQKITNTKFLPDDGNPLGKKVVVIPTLEGDMQASINDYVIKGVKGEFYPCKPDIFDQTYEVVEN